MTSQHSAPQRTPAVVALPSGLGQMATFHAILSVLPIVAFIAIVVGVFRFEVRRRRDEEEAERRIYKTGVWLSDQ